MKKLFKIIFSIIIIPTIFFTNELIHSSEKIVVKQLLKTSKGLDGKNISYPKFKQAQLRLLKVNIPVGLKTPLHTHPAPMIVYVAQGKLKHVSGEIINYFKEGESFAEANYGREHYVENVGKNTAVIFVAVSTTVELPTTINK